jgi:hypothetical protein
LRQLVRFAKPQAQPTLAEALRSQGLPEEDALAPRLRRLVDEALATHLALAEPRAVYEEITAEAFAEVLAPLGLDPEQVVVGRIYPKAQALALYVATLGERLSDRIRQLFDEDALAEGYMLDAVASVGADLLSDLLSERFEAALAARGVERPRVLPYSPGYCGWPTAGQRPLFAALRPEGEIGVTLNDSCLMWPVKSVSGVLVGGPGEAQRFRPDFPYCRECQTHDCGRRMAAVLKR